MFGKLKDAIEAGRTAVSDAESAAEIENLSALLILDELGPTADAVRTRHIEAASAAGQRPLLVLGPEAELEHADLNLLCEYLPRAQDLAASTGHRPDAVQTYRLRRLSFILEKWSVSECRWIGPSAADLVDAWRASARAEVPNVTFLPAH
ncbi:MAG: hypothetical protein AAGK71_11760 [Pseudomonadota bacterium]